MKSKLLIYFQEDQKHTRSIIVNIYFSVFISIKTFAYYFLNVLNVEKLNIKKRENGNIYNRRKSVRNGTIPWLWVSVVPPLHEKPQKCGECCKVKRKNKRDLAADRKDYETK